jgi:hypothetical protein
MLFQEVGFDIVSIWNQVSWLAKAAVVLMAVVIVYVLSLIFRRKSSQP